MIKKENTIRARLTAEIVIMIIMMIAAVITLGVTLLQVEYPKMNFQAGKQITVIFEGKSNLYEATGTAQPAAGNLYYSWQQASGKSKCTYKLSYKETGERTFKLLKKKHKFEKNKVFTDPSFVCYTLGRASYNFQIVKTAGRNRTSKIHLRWLLR